VTPGSRPLNLLSEASGREAPEGIVVEARGITKRFPGVTANDAIDLTLRRGEVHCVLGENGAGKSTFVNILSGMIRPDAGTVLVDGAPVAFESPHDAIGCGIATVYQHFTLVPTLSIVENVALGQNSAVWLDLRRRSGELRKVLDVFELPIDPRTPVRHLSLGRQQRAEIIKAVSRDPRVLLLDEPTSILTPAEIEELFRIMARLKRDGVAIVFITHKLDQALGVSDRITILRQGRKAGELAPDLLASDPAAAARQIVALMFGGPAPADGSLRARPASGETIGTPRPLHRSPAEAVLTLESVTVLGSPAGPGLRDLTLALRRGEIFGVAGVDGNGQKELAEVIAGQRRPAGGRILLDRREVTHTDSRGRISLGIGYVTDDRMGEGVVRRLSVAENLMLRSIDRPEFGARGTLDRAAIEAHARRLIEAFDIRTPGPWARVSTLSGGNIQKLLLARELAWTPRVLVCNQPTQGLDVRTAQFILDTLRARAREGMAVILISSDLDEIFSMSDRIGVIFNGRLLRTAPRAESTREDIGRLMLGGGA
jgi:general nucleoside transport system ATP-binding protein